MRLTVRTLLAWRDRVLSEEDQRDLDEKVLSHDAAQEIEQRIERVLGNLDLPSPRVDAAGLSASANSMAEFLDNALPEEYLGSFESNCIESDVQLCEAAECHQFLSEMLGQHELMAELTDEESHKLVELTSRKVLSLTGEVGHAADMENARAIRAELDTLAFDSRGDDSADVVYASRKKQLFAPLAIVVAIVMLLLLVSAFAVQLLRTFGGTQVQQQAGQSPVPTEIAFENNNANPKTDQIQQTRRTESSEEELPEKEPDKSLRGVDDGVKSQASQVVSSQPGTPSVPIEEEPRSSEADTPNPSMSNNVTVPQGTAMAIGASLPSASTSPLPPSKTTANANTLQKNVPVPVLDEPILGFLESDANIGRGVVLHRNREADRSELDGWLALPTESVLGPYEEIQVPPGLSPVLDVGGVTVRMKPRAHAIFKLDSLQKPRIELLSGSIVIRSADDTAQIGIAAGGLNGIILSGLMGSVAIDVSKAPSDVLAARQTRQSQIARVCALEKPVEWKQTQPGGLPVARPLRGISEAVQLSPQEILEWSETRPLEASLRTVDSLPTWAVSSRSLSRLKKSASESLAEAITRPEPLLKSLIELSDDSRIENRMIAVETLALLGWYDQLVELLASAPRPGPGPSAEMWKQLEGQSVPPALADATQAFALKKSLRDHVRPEQGEILVGLAARSLLSDAKEARTPKLISLLEDENIIFRRYAIQWLRELYEESPPDMAKYRADWSEKQLVEGADFWRKRYDQGLLSPRTP
ncbi:MAG: hypothetical protein MUQ67_05550 [Pirellulales bacterium]|nr:hypothetical protein [Pirellulales bacterium]